MWTCRYSKYMHVRFLRLQMFQHNIVCKSVCVRLSRAEVVEAQQTLWNANKPLQHSSQSSVRCCPTGDPACGPTPLPPLTPTSIFTSTEPPSPFDRIPVPTLCFSCHGDSLSRLFFSKHVQISSFEQRQSLH